MSSGAHGGLLMSTTTPRTCRSKAASSWANWSICSAEKGSIAGLAPETDAATPPARCCVSSICVMKQLRTAKWS